MKGPYEKCYFTVRDAGGFVYRYRERRLVLVGYVH